MLNFREASQASPLMWLMVRHPPNLEFLHMNVLDPWNKNSGNYPNILLVS